METVQETKEHLEETKESHFQEKKIYWEIYRENRVEEEEWRLKSRNLSLKAGDKNTTFFHNSTKMHRIINQIDSIKIDDKEIRGQEALKKEAYSDFKKLLTAESANLDYETFIQHIPNKISGENNFELTKEVDENEIQSTVWDLHLDKAPGSRYVKNIV